MGLEVYLYIRVEDWHSGRSHQSQVLQEQRDRVKLRHTSEELLRYKNVVKEDHVYATYEPKAETTD